MLRTSHHSTGATLGRAALIVAHPGHELNLMGWLTMSQPSVFVMTDGSGQHGRSRLHSTTRTLLRCGARPGSMYGHLSDREVYEAMLDQDVDLFVRLTVELAESLCLDDVDYVVGDSAEGYSPTHDFCRTIIGGAVELAAGVRGPLGNYEYVIAGPRLDCVMGRCRGAIKLTLDDQALERKIAAARGYPELAGEVQSAVERHGLESFRHECLHPVDQRKSWTPDGSSQPHYEIHGQSRVAAGKYRRAVSYADHVAPLQAAVREALPRSLEAPVGTSMAGVGMG